MSKFKLRICPVLVALILGADQQVHITNQKDVGFKLLLWCSAPLKGYQNSVDSCIISVQAALNYAGCQLPFAGTEHEPPHPP